MYDTDFRVIRNDGVTRWMSGYGRITGVDDGRPTCMSGVMVDSTDRKLAEQSLREADRRKNEFLALLAHELRNPIATLSNTLLILKLTGGTNEQLPLDSALALMSRDMGQLVRLVDDLLDISRISQGKTQLQISHLDLTELVRHTVEATRPQLEVGGRQFDSSLPNEPLYLDGDEARLTQIIRNLLSNAGKFTREGGHIWLSLERTATEAILRVRDDGIGLADDQTEQIFALFVQVDASRGRAQGGLGIGLPLVKEFVDMHGGSVQVYSAGIGQGSEFVVKLPLTDYNRKNKTTDESKRSNVSGLSGADH